MIARVRLAWEIRSGRWVKSSPMMVTSAASIATPVPPQPMAIPTSATANAGASLIPSPTITTGPFSLSCSMTAALSVGNRPVSQRALQGGHHRWVPVLPTTQALYSAERTTSAHGSPPAPPGRVRPSAGSIVGVMRRVLVPVLSLYLLAALIGRVAEKQDRSVCGCSADCWCNKPVLSVFRWVFPLAHSGPSPEEKSELDHAHSS